MYDLVFKSTSMAKLDDDKKSVFVANFDNKELYQDICLTRKNKTIGNNVKLLRVCLLKF